MPPKKAPKPPKATKNPPQLSIAPGSTIKWAGDLQSELAQLKQLMQQQQQQVQQDPR